MSKPAKVGRYLILLISLFLMLAPTIQANQAIPNTDIVPYGTNTFLDKEVESWKKERTFQLINEGGMRWIKQLFAWNEIEFKKGYFIDDKNNKSGWQKFDEIVELATKYDIKVVARIDQTPSWANPAGGKPGGRPANFQDYADFLKEFVKHYKGKIQYIQVWNEPNLEREWIPGEVVQAKQYVEMLKVAYASIKEADPSVKVMAAPLAITLEEKINLSELLYLEQMYQAGAKDFFDIMPANAYGLEFTPEAAPDPKVLNFRRVELLRNVMVKNGDANKAVWFNEYGWNASPANMSTDKLTWRRVSEQQQADYTARGIKYAKQNWPWVGVIFIWFFRQVGDIGDDQSEQYFQLVTKDFVAKPVYDAIKRDALIYLQTRGIPILPTTKPIPSPTPIVIPTVPNQIAPTRTASSQPSIVANVPPNNTAAGTVATTASQSDNGSLIIIVGIGLVIAALGGLGLWLMAQRRANR